jgi:hypothetical protein
MLVDINAPAKSEKTQRQQEGDPHMTHPLAGETDG